MLESRYCWSSTGLAGDAYIDARCVSLDIPPSSRAVLADTMRRLLQSHRRPTRVVRRLLQSGRASSSALPLLRLPTALFPSQPLSLRLTLSDAERVGGDPLSLQAPHADRVEGEPLSLETPGMSLPAELVSCAWRDFDGKVVAVSCGHVGVELHLLADHTLDACRLG